MYFIGSTLLYEARIVWVRKLVFTERKKSTFALLFQLPKIKRRFAAFLEGATNPGFLVGGVATADRPKAKAKAKNKKSAATAKPAHTPEAAG